ncbi:hypothetical protein SPRG_20022 [Saprolegnia parasitica CBS 223.65]|uniref:Uncharacterized protein n=1 Tax=Saprolegnia parasitica (strain CBS 223.65) TaxID=695850 RepID=A0A067CDI7_SAPPC|nr:hypothetical protein SPRG_20022 [Saprolegnia parasitica CBS 223.65]KDO28819.1 hypothetical protein SPRG_20022 [Saprolegnia parasitica CBS 223.65]|eukprot:XP_012200550.1 hypothetical protein SPRG_20022 [Saprolegnia parasitica CBS 223.65]
MQRGGRDGAHCRHQARSTRNGLAPDRTRRQRPFESQRRLWSALLCVHARARRRGVALARRRRRPQLQRAIASRGLVAVPAERRYCAAADGACPRRGRRLQAQLDGSTSHIT